MYQVRAALRVAKSKDIEFDVGSFNLLDSGVVDTSMYFSTSMHRSYFEIFSILKK
mgnify:CR=1 FL=1